MEEKKTVEKQKPNNQMSSDSRLFDDIVGLAVKSGFFYPSCEIYGSKGGFYDYGHLGTIMKRKWENMWRRFFLGLNDNFWEIDGSNLMPQDVFIGSGHLANFNDPLIECKRCKARHRIDTIIESALGIDSNDLTIDQMNELVAKHRLKCPECGGELSIVQWFNMMFDVTIGPSLGELKGVFKDLKKKAVKTVPYDRILEIYDAVESNTCYLRPETAQTPYMCFKREFDSLRGKLPLGLAVIGRAYRNEISPRQALFRMREFTQAELQIFIDPNDIDRTSSCPDYPSVSVRELNVRRAGKKETEKATVDSLGLPKMYAYYMAKVHQFLTEVIGIPENKLLFRELGENEKAFYNKIHWDVEFYFESFASYREIAGIHYRGDHDLAGHGKASGQNLKATRLDGSLFYPHVIELSFGVDRNLFAILDVAYNVEDAPTAKGGTEKRIVLKLPVQMAPIQVAVFPLLSNREELVSRSKDVYTLLSKKFRCVYDESGAIGRRYRRQDEVGTPFCVTIDFDTLDDGSVTVRDRDTMKQERVMVRDLLSYFERKYGVE